VFTRLLNLNNFNKLKKNTIVKKIFNKQLPKQMHTKRKGGGLKGKFAEGNAHEIGGGV